MIEMTYNLIINHPLGNKINERISVNGSGRKSRPRGSAKHETLFEKNIKKFKIRRA